MENAINSVLGFLSGTGLKWAQGVSILLIGLVVIKYLARFVKVGLIKTTNNRTMSTFVTSILNVVLTFVLVLAVFGIVGIDTNGLMELLSACVIAIGLSLKDSVGHLASGLIIVSTKPFKEGDYVNIGGVEGTVKSVRMFNTQVRTVDNKIITVPNSNVIGNNIINYDSLATRRVDIVLGVAYGSDIEKCRKVFKSVVEKNELILKTPEPSYVISEHGASSVNFTVKAWTRKENYHTVKAELLEGFYIAMQENGIEIPYNTIDVNVKNPTQVTSEINIQKEGN